MSNCRRRRHIVSARDTNCSLSEVINRLFLFQGRLSLTINMKCQLHETETQRLASFLR